MICAVLVAGQDISRIPRAAVPYLRRNLGLTFQDQKLLDDRSALDNVMLPLVCTGARLAEARSRARAALAETVREVAHRNAGADTSVREHPAVRRAVAALLRHGVDVARSEVR